MIEVTYSSVDGYTETRKYKTLQGARRWVDEMLGDNYELGQHYAVSGDGVGTVQIYGTTSLRALLNTPAR
jgi:hypothetical protein